MKTLHAENQDYGSSLEVGIEDNMVSFEPGMTLAEIEKLVILDTLRRHDQNRTHTARSLGIGIRTLQRKIKQYNSDTSPAFVEAQNHRRMNEHASAVHFY
jgi:DNA-binding NtrC family response regulator